MSDQLTPTQCEDFPCCGHEQGDCEGGLHDSDDAIQNHVYQQMNNPNYDPYYDAEDY